jgi:hypothetical protein
MSLSLCSKLTRILRDMGRSLKHKEPDSEPAMIQSGSLGLGGSGGDGGWGKPPGQARASVGTCRMPLGQASGCWRPFPTGRSRPHFSYHAAPSTGLYGLGDGKRRLKGARVVRAKQNPQTHRADLSETPTISALARWSWGMSSSPAPSEPPWRRRGVGAARRVSADNGVAKGQGWNFRRLGKLDWVSRAATPHPPVPIAALA